jgi:hypothetical protein
MAGLCSDSGSNDEEEDAANTQDSGNDFPLVGSLALLEELFFGLNQLLLQFLFGFVAEPSRLSLRTCRGQEQDEEGVFEFHEGCKEESQPPPRGQMTGFSSGYGVLRFSSSDDIQRRIRSWRRPFPVRE